MSHQTLTYPWQRYLCPVNEQYSQTKDSFLIRPDPSAIWTENHHLQTAHALANQPCLVILGEPGIGKSSVLTTMVNLLEADVTVVQESFAHFANAGELRSELFENPTFDHWRSGNGLLYLFFDALDEAHERIPVLMGALLRNLHGQPCHRLRLRIFCRTASWPTDYTAALATCWPQDPPAIYKVTTLSRADVQIAAVAHGVDYTEFIQQLTTSEVTPFAAIPLTLKLLLGLFSDAGSLPRSRSELYAQGCQRLCRERKPPHGYQSFRTTSLEQRLMVVERLAALTLLTGRDRIDASVDPEFTRSTHLALDDAVGYRETRQGHTIEVTALVTREALDTGLFLSPALNQYVWLHRTFQEYLAARYLVRHLTPAQILDFFSLSQDPQAQFPPQLEGLAAWFATLGPFLKQDLLQRDPVMLMRADATIVTHEERAAVVDWLLAAVDRQQFFAGIEEYQLYQKLGHPNLVDQLRRALTADQLAVEARRLAVELTECNGLQELQDTLVQLAVDDRLPLLLRVDAAHAITRIGDNNAKAQLRPLLQDSSADSYQQLKSAALRALWPAQLTAAELFAILTPRGSNTRIDLHRSFLVHDIIDNLQIADLPYALAWVTAHTDYRPAEHEIERLKDDIVNRSLMYLADGNVRSALMDTLLYKLEHHDVLVRTSSADWADHPILSDETIRRNLFTLLFDRALTSGHDAALLSMSRPSLITSADLAWLLHDLYPHLSITGKTVLVTIIHGLWYYGDLEQTALIYEAIQRHEILANHLAIKFAPIRINSAQAQKLRGQFRRVRSLSIIEEQSTVVENKAMLENLVTEVEQDPTTWWRLNLRLLAYPNGHNYVDEHESDITKLPGWTAIDGDVQRRIVRTAEAYLFHSDPNNGHWFENLEIRYRPAEAGYRAFCLLAQIEPRQLVQLSFATWQKWSLTIVTAYRWAFSADQAVGTKLLSLLATKAPIAYHLAAVQALHYTPSASELRRLVATLHHQWHPTFSTVLWQQLDLHADDSDYRQALLPYLVQHDLENAKAYVARYLPQADLDQSLFDEETVMVANHLLCHAQDAGWSLLWPIISTNPAFGKQLLLYASHELAYRNPPFVTRFDVPQLAMFYQWLIVHFPYADDPPTPQGSYTPTPLQQVCRLRNSCLTTLVHLGSKEAVDAIAVIVVQYPTIPDGHFQLFAAQEELRRHSWQPSEPAQLLELTHPDTASSAPLFDQRNQSVGTNVNIVGDVHIHT